ncbi:hypothetical protein XV03_19665 [Mycobacterium avium subsp. hominissuis]|uniref:Uncharacterized protein n=1 Tax=Mycobacterium avium subsp. hominissuis TaxID=439334 RepID=A0A2A3L4H4_MYCAV|nr:hypothetical protein XV03_19665 [Mycobacterium avium subsp. hominissuis]
MSRPRSLINAIMWGHRRHNVVGLISISVAWVTRGDQVAFFGDQLSQSVLIGGFVIADDIR